MKNFRKNLSTVLVLLALVGCGQNKGVKNNSLASQNEINTESLEVPLELSVEEAVTLCKDNSDTMLSYEIGMSKREVNSQMFKTTTCDSSGNCESISCSLDNTSIKTILDVTKENVFIYSSSTNNLDELSNDCQVFLQNKSLYGTGNKIEQELRIPKIFLNENQSLINSLNKNHVENNGSITMKGKKIILEIKNIEDISHMRQTVDLSESLFYQGEHIDSSTVLKELNNEDDILSVTELTVYVTSVVKIEDTDTETLDLSDVEFCNDAGSCKRSDFSYMFQNK
jgi:hypothetical protein